ncbi:MAG TPA: hypothetical protein VKD71_11110 [Gemmataceae bacterium]|nr:hypothetical protein [Gemmataceae bacterium]
MTDPVERIRTQDAARDLKDNPPALLVCAYDDEEKCRQNRLDGSMSLAEFRARESTIPKSREIIFYCA